MSGTLKDIFQNVENRNESKKEKKEEREKRERKRREGKRRREGVRVRMIETKTAHHGGDSKIEML